MSLTADRGRLNAAPDPTSDVHAWTAGLDREAAQRPDGGIRSRHAFYGHLAGDDRERFLTEARRIAYELVVVDSAARGDVDREGWQERILNDGSRHRVFKRYLTPERLADELGGEALYAGRWFVVGRTSAS